MKCQTIIEQDNSVIVGNNEGNSEGMEDLDYEEIEDEKIDMSKTSTKCNSSSY